VHATTPETATAGSALWNGQALMPAVRPRRVSVVRGSGAYVETSDGQRLLDATAGLWHANVGHGRESIARAAYDQMCKLETYHLFGRFANEPALRLADRLAAMAPVVGSKVFLTSGGSDAVDLACKLARRHWQLAGRPDKRIVVTRELAYHGLHAFGSSVGGLDFNREGYGSASLVPETARIPTHGLAAATAAIEAIGPERVAAIMTEPVIGTGGVLAPEPGYLQGLSALAAEHDILFIVDEVITGFGRTGVMFACERFGLAPDMVLFAKGVTSGYAPLGGVLVAPSVAGRFFAEGSEDVFRHGLTYMGHATGCAVAEANLGVLEREALVARAAELEGVLHRAVQPLSGHPLVRDVRSGTGFLCGVQLHPQVPGDQVASACIDRGVAMRVITANTLQVSPPFVVTDSEVATIAEVIGAALDEVLEGQADL
jgi:adenosylmethionine-8-amino-7-oxononanoate aminotransferase